MSDVNPITVEFTPRMVRELKGAPLAVLVLLASVDEPVNNQWLISMSGYSDKPVAQALTMLASQDYQLVVRTHTGWMIHPGFAMSLINRRNSVPTTTTELVLIKNNNHIVVVGSEKFRLNLEACKSVGIGEPSASQLSDLEHVTPEFIRGHVAALQQGERLGMAIVRIRNNELLPEQRTQSVQPPARYSMDSFISAE